MSAAGSGIQKPADIVSTFQQGMQGVSDQINAVTTNAGSPPDTLVFGQGVLSDSDPDFGGPATLMAQQYTVAVQSYLTGSGSAVGQLQDKVTTLSRAAQSAATIYQNGAATEQEAATAIQQQLSSPTSTAL